MIGVGDRKWSPPGDPAEAPGNIGLLQVAQQGCQGQAIAGDVMHDQYDDVAVDGLPENPEADRQVAFQVEGACAALLHQRHAFLFVESGHVEHGAQIGDLGNHHQALEGFAVDGNHDGAQGFLTFDDVTQRLLQCGNVEGAPQPGDQGEVVGGGSLLQTCDGPQPALRERCRQLLGSGAVDDAFDPAPDVRCRLGGQVVGRLRGLVAAAGWGFGVVCRLQPGRQGTGRRRLEDVAQPQPLLRSTKSRHDPGGDQ